MSSHREHKMLPCKLKGDGVEVDCMVSVTKVSLPGTDVFEYVRPELHNAPTLPDGLYTITYGGRTDTVKLRYGRLMNANP